MGADTYQERCPELVEELPDELLDWSVDVPSVAVLVPVALVAVAVCVDDVWTSPPEEQKSLYHFSSLERSEGFVQLSQIPFALECNEVIRLDWQKQET